MLMMWNPCILLAENMEETCLCCWKLLYFHEAFIVWFIAFFQRFPGKISAAPILPRVFRWQMLQGTAWHTECVDVVLSPICTWVVMPEGYHKTPDSQWALYAWLRYVFHHVTDNTSHLAEKALILHLGSHVATETAQRGVAAYCTRRELHLKAAAACCAVMT